MVETSVDQETFGSKNNKIIKNDCINCKKIDEERLNNQNGIITPTSLLSSLSWLDKLLTPLIIISMIIGVIIGEYAKDARKNLSKGDLYGVSAPLVIGLIVMMWPILTKVPFEKLHKTFQTGRLWRQIGLSLILNWLIGPFLMLGLAFATLPDLPTYRTGIIMVGLARCIAMVMIWNQMAKGDVEICGILVIINSILQIVLYAPFCVWFINVISNASEEFSLRYGTTAISVLIYLGIPLIAGVLTRFGMMFLLGRKKFENKFLPFFGPISLIALLYTIIIIFSEQSERILDNLGPTFRTIVPLILYFSIMWTSTFLFVWQLSKRETKFNENQIDELKHSEQQQHICTIKSNQNWGYEMAVVQAFTAGSNNFELAISVAVAVYGANSDEALAASIGPLVEVPVLLALSWLALWLKQKWKW